ncbi:MAG TPA: integrase, partial [Bacteroidales bacterium]|nr:integrase [Bacteroidales bacterium]
ATNMYRAGIKALNIMRITGHRSEKTFLRYIRQTNEEVAEELAQHPYFTGNSLKVAN